MGSAPSRNHRGPIVTVVVMLGLTLVAFVAWSVTVSQRRTREAQAATDQMLTEHARRRLRRDKELNELRDGVLRAQKSLLDAQEKRRRAAATALNETAASQATRRTPDTALASPGPRAGVPASRPAAGSIIPTKPTIDPDPLHGVMDEEPTATRASARRKR